MEDMGFSRLGYLATQGSWYETGWKKGFGDGSSDCETGRVI